MHGYITTNNQYCGQQAPALPSVVAGEEEPSVISTVSRFKLYPNPTSGNFTIEEKSEKVCGNVQVEIYGMNGEKLMSGVMSGERKHEFMVTDLPQGLYFVKVISDNNPETFKLIKTN